jgi:hypothetical protein
MSSSATIALRQIASAIIRTRKNPLPHRHFFTRSLRLAAQSRGLRRNPPDLRNAGSTQQFLRRPLFQNIWSGAYSERRGMNVRLLPVS